jgi:ribonuclease-3 family protein
LAFVGDGVFELLVRERLVAEGARPAHKLHALAVKKVRASAQASAYHALEQILTDDEAAVLKRGRNANTTRVPKSCAPEEYRKATGVEALFGWLWLSGRAERVAGLFAMIYDGGQHADIV